MQLTYTYSAEVYNLLDFCRKEREEVFGNGTGFGRGFASEHAASITINNKDVQRYKRKNSC